MLLLGKGDRISFRVFALVAWLFFSAELTDMSSKPFFRKIGEPQKAEAFLLDAVKMYRHEGWHSLAHATMRELAACQKQMGHTNRLVHEV